MNKISEPSNKKSDGIYYVLCFNNKWRVEAFRTDQYGDIGHMKIWEEYLAPNLARVFKLDEEGASLLKISYAGFPRGRVQLIGRRFIVYNGNDYAHLVSKSDILKPFGLSDAKFEFDDHERALMQDRDTIRQLLNIKETWPAVS